MKTSLLVIFLFYFLSSQVFAGNENSNDYYKNLIIAKWFKTKKIFDIEMSLNLNNVPINQLKEINNSFFPLYNIKKMFVLDLAKRPHFFLKSRKVLVVNNDNKAHFLETESDVFGFVAKKYKAENYGVQFLFETLLFLKYARGYNFIVNQNLDKYYNEFNKNDSDILKNNNGITMTRKNNVILCQSLFSTINGNVVIIIEVKMSPKSILVTKKKEKVFWDFI